MMFLIKPNIIVFIFLTKGKYIFVIHKFMEIKSIKEEKSIQEMSEFKTSVFTFRRKGKNKTNKDISNAN